MSQIALPLDWPANDADDAFVVSPSNEAAVKSLEAFGRWPVPAAILTGPRKSGRSLLGRIFAARTGATLIDDADRRDERALFRAWNCAQDTRRPLLMIADEAPPAWTVVLPDLRSRLAATPQLTLGDPDQALLAGLIPRLLERRGLAASPEVIAYLVPRVERCHVPVISLVDAIDIAALAQRRAVTVPLVREVLEGRQRAAVGG